MNARDGRGGPGAAPGGALDRTVKGDARGRSQTTLRGLGVDLLCGLLLFASGVVLGFCLGGWLGPLLFWSNGGLEELGFLFNGAILGGGSGVLVFLVTLRTLARPRRLRLSLGALGVAAVGAFATWGAVALFDAW